MINQLRNRRSSMLAVALAAALVAPRMAEATTPAKQVSPAQLHRQGGADHDGRLMAAGLHGTRNAAAQIAAASHPADPSVRLIDDHAPASSSGSEYQTGVEKVPTFSVRLARGTSRIVTTHGEIASVYVADPSVVTVKPVSGHRLSISGADTGSTAVVAVDKTGTPIAKFNISVGASQYPAISVHAGLPEGMEATAVPNAIKLSGHAQTPLEAYQAHQAAKAIAGKQKVLNGVSVDMPQQVMLKVRIAEMSRSVIREFGINWQSLGKYNAQGMLLGGAKQVSSLILKPHGAIAGMTVGNLAPAGTPGNYSLAFPHSNLDGILSALDQDNLAHLLAEPTLTALSGHSASFISGGSFPVPSSGGLGTTNVTFQKYGVQLEFKPTVLSSGAIMMDVSPTVSQPSSLNAVSVTSNGSTTVVPSLTQQSASTTVVLGSGQTLAIAGLLENRTTQTDNSVPGLGDVPVLGGAFRSDDFSRSQDELVVLVTPYLVRAISNPAALRLPGEGYTSPNFVQRFLFGRQTGATPMTLPAGVGMMLQ